MKLTKIVREMNSWIDSIAMDFMRKYLGESEFPKITNYIEGAQVDYRNEIK